MVQLKPLVFEDRNWTPSGEPFQHVSLNDVLLFRIEWDKVHGNPYRITSFGLVPKTIIADKAESDVYFLPINSFKTLEDAQRKCEEIVENFVKFFLEE
jgi:hypothetical protein